MNASDGRALEAGRASQSPEHVVLDWVRARPLVSFFVLAYALNFGAYFPYLTIPGLVLAPFWLLGVFSPTIAALIVSGVVGGSAEVRRLLSGFSRWRIGWHWFLAASTTVLIPLLLAIGYIGLGNEPVGPVAGTTVMFLAGQLVYTLLSGPLSEEAGWRGFALPRLQQRHSALTASVILGVIWTFWHVPVYFLPDATMIPLPMFLPMTIGLSILFAWVYNNTGGSLIATVLMHFSFNVSGAFLAGHLGLMPPMVLYIGGGIAIGLLTVAVVAWFGWRRLARVPIAVS
jgi:membrane protease YdiL (CAAX protease family)